VEEKVHSYPLPDNVALLNRLAEIIKWYPWNQDLLLWEKKFKVSTEWLRLIKELMWK
jgi:hypothetical protein